MTDDRPLLTGLNALRTVLIDLLRLLLISTASGAFRQRLQSCILKIVAQNLRDVRRLAVPVEDLAARLQLSCISTF